MINSGDIAGQYLIEVYINPIIVPKSLPEEDSTIDLRITITKKQNFLSQKVLYRTVLDFVLTNRH